MKKLFLVILICFIFVGCSTPEERYNSAEKISKNIIYQKYVSEYSISDIFIGEEGDCLYLIEVNNAGNIFNIQRFKKEKICNLK